MKKTILSALIFAPLFAGCVSTADNSGDLDRNAVVAELTTRMDTLGYQYPVDVVPGINAVSYTHLTLPTTPYV